MGSTLLLTGLLTGALVLAGRPPGSVPVRASDRRSDPVGLAGDPPRSLQFPASNCWASIRSFPWPLRLHPRPHRLEHSLQLGQHLPGTLSRAAAGQLPRHLDHIAQVLGLQGFGRRVDRNWNDSPAAGQLRRHRLEILVQRPLQFVHQPLDLGQARVAAQRLPKLLTGVAQLPVPQAEPCLLPSEAPFPTADSCTEGTASVPRSLISLALVMESARDTTGS